MRPNVAYVTGGRVTVGFTPRPGDPWSVGGGTADDLPAGELDGATLRTSATRAASDASDGSDAGDAPGTGRTASAPDVSGADVTVSAPDGSVDQPGSVSAPDESVDQPANPGAATDARPASFITSRESPLLATTTDATVSASGLRREVFGFLPYWELPSKTLRLDYTKLSTIASHKASGSSPAD